MMGYSTVQVWVIIIALGVGTYAIRFAFLGLFGDRKLPDWAMAHLRYTPVAIMPGLVAPLVLQSGADGSVDPTRAFAAAVAIAVGLWTKNTLWTIGSGAAALAVVLLV